MTIGLGNRASLGEEPGLSAGRSHRPGLSEAGRVKLVF